MEKIPFSVYDFFAYLSSGVVLAATADYVWNLGLMTREKVNPFLGIALVILTYVAGHVVAHFSSLFFERLVVHRILKSPSLLLLDACPRLRIFKWAFPNYYRPLSKSTQQRIQEQLAARKCNVQGEALFQHVYPVVTANDRFQLRLDDFRNQYGFARNMSFAFFVAAVVIAIAHWHGPHAVQLRWAIIAALASVTLFYRYLKFFRQYSYELLLRYSELDFTDVRAALAGA